jgi:hypothetical protein
MNSIIVIDVILTTTVSNPFLTLNQMVPLQLQQVHLGTSNIKYQICEIGSNPANCSTAIVTVNVSKQQ